MVRYAILNYNMSRKGCLKTRQTELGLPQMVAIDVDNDRLK